MTVTYWYHDSQPPMIYQAVQLVKAASQAGIGIKIAICTQTARLLIMMMLCKAS